VCKNNSFQEGRKNKYGVRYFYFIKLPQSMEREAPQPEITPTETDSESLKRKREDEDEISTVDESTEFPKKKKRKTENEKKRKIPNPFTVGPDTHAFIHLINIPSDVIDSTIEQITAYADGCNKQPLGSDLKMKVSSINPRLVRVSLDEEAKRERDLLSRLKYSQKPETIEKRRKLYESEEYKKAKAEALKNPLIQEQKKISQKANRLLLKEFKKSDRKAYELKRLQIKKELEASKK